MCTVGERGSCVLERLEDVAEVAVDGIGDELQELFRHRNEIDAGCTVLTRAKGIPPTAR